MANLIVSDMEGTLSEGVTWRGLRDYLLSHGRGHAFRAFLRRNILRVVQYRLGWGNTQQFREDWIVGVLGLYAGYTVEEFHHAGKWVIEQELWPQRRQTVLDELAAHQASGRRVVLASGMFQPLLEIWAAKIGAEAFGTPIEIVDGKLTGRIAGPFNTGEQKAACVQGLVAEGGVLVGAYGDTFADRFMLEMVEEEGEGGATAVCPDDKLRDLAHQRGWRILY